MAKSKTKERLFNMAYGIGAAIIILGALFKLQHWPFADVMLIVGMSVEALIFVLSAFEPIEETYDWTKVYPELADGTPSQRREERGGQVVSTNDAESMLSQKLDAILKEARFDANLVSSLGTSIRNFQGAVKPLADASQSISATNNYNEQMLKAATQLETLNNLYKTQLESTIKQTELNSAMVQNYQQLQQQMNALSKNLASLNSVYGGMLSAMTNK